MVLRRLAFSALGLLLLALAPAPRILAATDASGVVTDFGDRALKMLNDPGLSDSERRKRFHALLDEDFDFDIVSRFVLGRYWQGASDAERRDFAAVFKDYVVQSYANRFNEFSDTSFRVIGERAEGDTNTVVRTDVSRKGGAPAKVDWRVTKVTTGYKITEVSIDGISMSLTHRQEFASIMEKNGGHVSDLIAALRSKVSSAQ
ncbi:MAG TPA: ABC transporter substrate-binding protein [Stellaceae bacterium]|nr:ABC transporter substrate-binding protein [Stellaceae bacterium]